MDSSFVSESEKESVAMDHYNMHNTHEDMKVHTIVTNEMDYDHQSALLIPLGEVSDEQLVAELAERSLNADSSSSITYDSEAHVRSMKIPLEAVTDDELLAEVIRRKLDICDDINENSVYATYELSKELGHGASGKVFKAKHKETGLDYACKVVERDARMNDAQSMSTEVEIMKRIRHQNIVAMYEIYQTPRCLWLILELVDGGDLRGFLMQQRNSYSEAMAARHMKQILLGVHHLHSMGVVHRDLKLENILLKVHRRDSKDVSLLC
jgi:serine/threonine protein kinase